MCGGGESRSAAARHGKGRQAREEMGGGAESEAVKQEPRAEMPPLAQGSVVDATRRPNWPTVTRAGAPSPTADRPARRKVPATRRPGRSDRDSPLQPNESH